MLPILYQDEHYVAVDKPSGLLVHRTTLSRDRTFLLQQLRDQLGRRVWPVHRLDRATSGVLILAFDSASAGALARQFSEQTTHKRYLALARGWLEPSGTIDHPVYTAGKKRRKEAVTRYWCLAKVELPVSVDRYPTSRYSLAEIEPLSGRYQQIRQHFKHISHQLIGDTTWGNGRHNRYFREHYRIRRLLLHAWRLGFRHPHRGDLLTIQADIDPQWCELFQSFGWDCNPFTSSRTSRA
ncbi:MAG TPA: pseudouridylate synthase [Chromatiaceae bacterium]|nr:pseudouridylate synthase [Chromatiaceae bacterium]